MTALRHEAAKPYLHPIVAPSGRVLTRVGGQHHSWHRGLWFAIKYVDGDNFWEEQPPFGVQRDAGDGRVEWVRPDGRIAIVETRTVAVAGGVIDWTSTLSSTDPVVLERTPYTTWGGYGGLTFRGAGDWSDTRLLLDDGSVHRRPEGVPSRWCDLSNDECGIAFLDHPSNPRHPVPWYGATRSRVYGDDWANYLNAAFLFHEGMTMTGELTFRYRLVVHEGPWDVARCDAAWAEFAAA